MKCNLKTLGTFLQGQEKKGKKGNYLISLSLNLTVELWAL